MAKTMASLGSKLAAVSELSDFPTQRHTIKLDDFNKGVPFSFLFFFSVWAKTITLDYLYTHTPCPSASDLAQQLSHQTDESPVVPNFWRLSWVGSHLWSQRLFRLLYKI